MVDQTKTKAKDSSSFDLQTFFEKFALLADTPNAIPELRHCIVQFAIRGLLTIQDANETVEAQLACAGKSAKDCSAQRLPFDIPRNWASLAIGDVVKMFNGKAFKKEEWATSGLPIIRIQNLNNENAAFNYCASNVEKRYRVFNDDLLISWSGTPGTSFGAFIWTRGDACLNQHIFRCEVTEGVFDLYFLRLAINARLDEMISHAQGAVGLRHITKGKLESIRLALPPIDEQKRIVAKVDELMGLCDQLEAEQAERQARHATLSRAALARFANSPTPTNLKYLFHNSFDIEPDGIRRSVFSLAFSGKLVSTKDQNPLSSEISIEELVGRKNLKNGLSVRPTEAKTRFRCLKLSALRDGLVDCSGGKPVSLTDVEAAPYLIRKGDVFIVRGNGSKDFVGRAGRVHAEEESVIFPDLFIRVPLPTDQIMPEYFTLVWNSPTMRKRIKKLARTTSGIWKINQGHVASLTLPLPPIAEQNRIVAKVDQLISLVDVLEQQLAKSRIHGEQLMKAVVSQLISVSPNATSR